MRTPIGVSSHKIAKQAAKIAAALKKLRETLGRSRDQMARAVGCSYPVYGHWEAGRTVPRHDDLERIAQSVEDRRVRMEFWLDIYSEGIKLGGTLGKTVTQRDALILRYANDAIEGVRQLCLTAAQGSTASEEQLREIADRVVRAAGNTRRTLDARSKRQKVR